ncbi:MAG TPA: hypothetical protein VK663_10350 [Burkholderiales bacterium]|nr:hypothetical protein [Burkholderiales bacterium]
MLADVPFMAINTDTIEWDANVTLFQLPTGAHKIHPNLKIKVLMRDDKQGQVAALVKFPPGYVEPAHQHVTSHCVTHHPTPCMGHSNTRWAASCLRCIAFRRRRQRILHKHPPTRPL